MERPDLTASARSCRTRESNRVLMLAWMDEEALRRTRETGEAWFWSRSRQSYWRKGETSGNTLAVEELRGRLRRRRDPPARTRRAGPVCHTGAESCFAPVAVARRSPSARLQRPEGSYVVTLLDDRRRRGARKVGEEGVEAALAARRRVGRAARARSSPTSGSTATPCLPPAGSTRSWSKKSWSAEPVATLREPFGASHRPLRPALDWPHGYRTVRIQSARDRAAVAKKVLAPPRRGDSVRDRSRRRPPEPPGDATAGIAGRPSIRLPTRLSDPELRLRPERYRPVRRKWRRRDRRYTCVLSSRASFRGDGSYGRSRRSRTTSRSNRSATSSPLREAVFSRFGAAASSRASAAARRPFSRSLPSFARARLGGPRRCRADQWTGRPDPRSGNRGCRLRPDSFAELRPGRAPARDLLTQARGGRSPRSAESSSAQRAQTRA